MRKYAWFIVGLAVILLMPIACKKKDKSCDTPTAPSVSVATFTPTMSLTPTTTPTGTQTPVSERIYFSTDRDGSSEVYRIDVDGTGLVRITTTAENENALWDWSHNSSKMFIQDGIYGIVKNLDGSGPVTVAPQGGWYSSSRSCWAYGANQLIITERSAASGSYSNRIASVAPDGSGHTALVTLSDKDISVFGANSTVGKIFYAVGDAYNANSGTLWTCNIDGTSATQIDATTGYRSCGAMSPDGQFLYAERKGSSGDSNIYKYALNGTGKIAVTTFSGSANADMSGMRISADGTRIVFSRKVETDDSHEIYVMNSDGSSLVRLTTTTSTENLYPVWVSSGL